MCGKHTCGLLPTQPSVHGRARVAEKRRLNNFESIDYLPPNSMVYRKWLARQVGASR